MNLSGIGTSSPQIRPNQASLNLQEAPKPSPSSVQIPTDELEISPAAQMMTEIDAATRNSMSRPELIAHIQQEIQQGTYESDEKMEEALMNFIDRIRLAS